MKKTAILICCAFMLQLPLAAQNPVEENQLGAWYMYFYQKKFANSQFGVQGDFQYRAWNLGSDREQLLLRSGITFRPKSEDIMFTLGYAYIGSGTPGDSDEVVADNRIYQEATMPQKIGERFYFNHRFRYEQRFVDGQDFRTRFRYNLFLNVPLNKKQMEKNALYLTLYNELFINGETEIGDGKSVQYFDRNRTYAGLGYFVGARSRVQIGWMKQTTTNWAKGQLQFSLHQNF
jgi:hypothetical protein